MNTFQKQMVLPLIILVAGATALTAADGDGDGGGGFGGGSFSATGHAGGFGATSQAGGGGGGGFGGGGIVATGPAGPGHPVFVQRLQHLIGPSSQREPVAWVGVAVSEASEALISQLGLPPGVGLEVTYVASNSPAAKAGIEKNDVLTQLEDQALVLPAQFRKLVQVRKEGDTVKVVYYRQGKEQTRSITLAKTDRFSGDDGPSGWQNKFSEDFKGNMKGMEGSFGNIKIDQEKIQEQVKRSMEQARRAYEQALRSYTNSSKNFDAAAKRFDLLIKSGVMLDNDATVTVRTTGNAVRSLVKADDSGTIVIVANPDLRLTAHDKQGKLLFDGDIQDSEQRSKVPPDLWQKVEPLVKKIEASPKLESEDEPADLAEPADEAQ
jgi:hypothetical protein